MNKTLATLQAGALAVLVNFAATDTADAGGRECDYLTPCNGNEQQQLQTQGQGQGQYQQAIGQGTGISNATGGAGGAGGAGGKGGYAKNTNTIGVKTGASADASSDVDVRNDINNILKTDASAVTGDQSTNVGVGGQETNVGGQSATTGKQETSLSVQDNSETKYVNPAQPGALVGQVNGVCMQTTGVSIGAYLASIAIQDGSFNADCAVWNTAKLLLENGINLNDPTYQAIALETFREFDERIDNAVITVLAAAQQRFERGHGPAKSPFALIDREGKHGQKFEHKSSYPEPQLSGAFE